VTLKLQVVILRSLLLVTPRRPSTAPSMYTPGKPTSASAPPSRSPTSIPSFAPTSFFSAYNASLSVIADGQFSSNAFITYYANDDTELVPVQDKWRSFIVNSLITPFKVAYTSITLITSLVGFSDTAPVWFYSVCLDSTVSHDIVTAIISSTSIIVLCDGTRWYFNGTSQSLCTNCTTLCHFSQQNPLIFNPLSDGTCGGVNNYKITGYISISVSSVTSDNVPVIKKLAANSTNTHIDINVTLASTESGYLYCAAFLDSFLVVSVLSIKSNGVFTAISSTDEHLRITDLEAFTNYKVYCYTGKRCVFLIAPFEVIFFMLYRGSTRQRSVSGRCKTCPHYHWMLSIYFLPQLPKVCLW
jgi:hypothetical protein